MKFIVNGGKKLKGEITVGGSKNAALPILAATLLTKRTCVIKNVPHIGDVLVMLELFESMGSEIEWLDENTLKIRNENLDPTKISKTLTRKIRSSILLIGPLLARFKEVKINTPGGCHIGIRPMDAHFDLFKDLGFDIKYNEQKDLYSITKSKKKGFKHVTLKEFSVTATENLLLFGSKNPLSVSIAATEPHVQDLGRFLIKLGAKIDGLGTHDIQIKKTISETGGEVRHTIVSDYIEAGTFMILGAATSSDITIKKVPVDDLVLPIQKLKEFGVKLEIKGNTVKVLGSKSKLKAVSKIKTEPYPGFPSDLQAPFAVLATQATGETLIFESMYEGRLKYLYELDKMGASVSILDTHRARILGPKKLKGKNVESLDLRAGATLIIAALVAQGESVLHEADRVDRGYEKIEERLKTLGAQIKREG